MGPPSTRKTENSKQTIDETNTRKQIAGKQRKNRSKQTKRSKSKCPNKR